MKHAWLMLPIALGACLDVTEGPKPMCVTTADCDSVNGEVCDEGICYGNPPQGSFAALVSPPGERTDLVARQMLDFQIPTDGRFADVQLDEPVTFKGTLLGCQGPLMCDTVSLAATITVTGKSGFTGGPSYLGVFQAVDHDGFTLKLPRTHGEDTYSVTIMPGGRDETGSTPAQLVPPRHLQLAASESQANQIIELGDAPTNYLVRGKISTLQNVPVGNYRVVAMGRWEPDAPLVEVSTVDYTGGDGTYVLRLSDGLVGNAQIVATGYDAVLRPTLTLAGVPTDKDSTAKNLTLPDQLGAARDFTQQVMSTDGSGTVGPVVGAHVVITGFVMQGETRATITAEGTTDEHGNATKLKLLDGADLAASYQLSVVPPANGSSSVAVAKAVSLASNALAPVNLPDRIAIRGVVRDYDGHPVKDVSVTARPSLRFLWSLEPAQQSVLSGIPPATTVTPESGEFVVFVDRALGDIWGHYDLVFEGTSDAAVPSYTAAEIEVPRDASVRTISLPDTYLPDAAYVHGNVVDPMGKTVEGAELKIYQLPSNQLTLCTEVLHAPASCPIPAQLLGRGASAGSGELRVLLPRP